VATRSLNRVQLIGNLTRDPELRYTPQGTAVCTFGLATNRYWVTEAGEKKEETEFHRIVAWNKLAELCAQLLFKGRKVYVEGRLQTRTWTAQDGTQRQATEVVIEDMIILDSRRQGEEELAGTQTSEAVVPEEVIPEATGEPAAQGDTQMAATVAQPAQDKTKKKDTKDNEEAGDASTASEEEVLPKEEAGTKEETKTDDEIPF